MLYICDKKNLKKKGCQLEEGIGGVLERVVGRSWEEEKERGMM